MSGLVHPDQNVRNATQNSLCRAVNRRRGCCACRASNCRRRASFSRTRSSREWKALTNQPRKCRSDTIMARIVAEKSESSFSQVIHSAGVRRFGEAHAKASWAASSAASKSPNSRIRAATIRPQSERQTASKAEVTSWGMPHDKDFWAPGCRFGLSPFDSPMEDRMKYMLLIYDDEILCSR